jgi:hypothetical protein
VPSASAATSTASTPAQTSSTVPSVVIATTTLE